MTNIGRRSLHYRLAKHGQAHLNYCIEAESHSCDFPVQAIQLTIRKLTGENSLYFADSGAKLAVLVLVGHVAPSSLLGRDGIINRAKFPQAGDSSWHKAQREIKFVFRVLLADAESQTRARAIGT